MCCAAIHKTQGWLNVLIDDGLELENVLKCVYYIRGLYEWFELIARDKDCIFFVYITGDSSWGKIVM